MHAELFESLRQGQLKESLLELGHDVHSLLQIRLINCINGIILRHMRIKIATLSYISSLLSRFDLALWGFGVLGFFDWKNAFQMGRLGSKFQKMLLKYSSKGRYFRHGHMPVKKWFSTL